MKLTKEQAIHEHRKMWRWLTEFYAAIDRWNGTSVDIDHAKEIYCRYNIHEDILFNCFCCEYARTDDKSYWGCGDCPIEWRDNAGDIVRVCVHGEFGVVDSLNDARSISKMCRKIAELPEKKRG